MKIVLLIAGLGLVACNQQTDDIEALKSRISSLESKLADTYKPGFGDFMGTIQAHHSKLWFAGQHENWKLADFEVHEIMEAVEGIQKFQAGRKETEMIDMIKPALDGINSAIKQQSLPRFESSYASLTEACNDCHRAADFEFNVVKIPDTLPFSNQDFRVNVPR